MRLDFKRFLSGVLALVMMTSALTMANVSSVMAARSDPQDFDQSTNSNIGTRVLSDGNKKSFWDFSSVPNNTTDFIVRDTVNGIYVEKVKVQAKNGALLINSGGIICIPVPEGSSGKIGFIGNQSAHSSSSDDRYIVLYRNDTATDKKVIPAATHTEPGYKNDPPLVNPYIDFSASNEDGSTDITEINGSSYLKFSSNLEKEIQFKSIEVILNDGYSYPSDGITWSFDENSKTTLKGDSGWTNIDTEKIAFKSSDNTETVNELVYNGNEFIVNPDYRFLNTTNTDFTTLGNAKYCIKLDGNNAQVVLKKDMFIPTKEFNLTDINFTSTDESGNDRFVRFHCEKHTNSIHTIYLDADGNAAGTVERNAATGVAEKKPATKIYLPQETFHVGIAGCDVTLTNPASEGSANEFTLGADTSKITGTFTPHERQMVTGAAKPDITKDLAINEDVDETYIYDGTVLGDYFEAHGTENFNGDFMLVRDENGMDEGSHSNVKAIELRTLDNEGGIADSSLRFETGDFTGKLGIKVTCSSAEGADSSMIGIREGEPKFAPSLVSKKTQEITKNAAVGTEDFIYEDLLPNKSYGIYNAGESNNNDNVRIYSVEFYVPAEAPKFVETIKADNDTLKEIYGLSSSDVNITENNTSLDPDNKLQAVVSSSNYISIGKNTKNVGTIDDGNDHGNVTMRLKFNSKGDKTKRAIKFTPVADGDVYVYGMTGSENSARWLELENSGGIQNKDGDIAQSSDYSMTKFKFSVKGNEENYLYASGGVNIYFIGSTVAFKPYGEVEPQPATGAKINFKIAGTVAPSAKIHVAVLDGDPIDSTSKKVKLKGTIQELSTANSSKNFENVAPNTKFIIIGETDSSHLATGKAPDNVYKWVPIVNGTPTEDNTSISFVNNGDKLKNYFIYTVPDDAEVGKTYGVAFYTDTTDNLVKGNVSDFKGDYKQAEDTSKTLVFGQYGVSEDKAVKNCGGGYVKDIAQKYQYAIPSMNDYLSNSLAEKAYNKIDPSSTESIYGTLHGLLHYNEDNNYIVFKVDDTVTNDVDESPITLQIDRSGDASMYDLGTTGTESPSSAMECEYISNSKDEKIAKQEYKINAGHVYKIVSSGQDSGSPQSGGDKFGKGGSAVIPKEEIKFGTAGASNVTQIKSIRVANPNNIFDETADDQAPIEDGVKITELDETLKAALDGDTSDDTLTVFRVIGKINVQGTTEAQIRAALSDINAVGYDVYEKSAYDEAEKHTITNHYHEGEILESEDTYKPELKDTITFKGVVNSAVDENTTKPDGDPSEQEYKYGQVGSVSKDTIFCQTFYALKPNTAVVLVPWVQYGSDSDAKVYSQILKENPQNNVKVLSTMPTE